MGFRDLIEEELKKKEQERQIEEQKRQITQEISIANEQRKNNILPTSRERRSSEILPRASERRTYLVREKKKLSKEVSENPNARPAGNESTFEGFINGVAQNPNPLVSTVTDIMATRVADEIEKDPVNGGVKSGLINFLGGGLEWGTGLGSLVVNPLGEAEKKLGEVFNNQDLYNAGVATQNRWKALNEITGIGSKITEKTDNETVKTINQVSRALGNMAPSIGLSVLTGGASAGASTGNKVTQYLAKNSGRITQALGVAGNEMTNTLNEDNSNFGQATLTGLAKGGLEYATEGIFGGNILSKGTSLDDLVAKGISSKVKSNVGQMLLSKGYEFGGEIAEEIISDTGGNLVDKIVNGKDMPNLKEWWENSGETAKTTFLTTAVLQALGLGGGTYNDVKQLNLNKQQEAEAQSWISEAENIIKNTSEEQNNQKRDQISRNDIVRQMNEESLPVKNEQFRYANRAYEESARKYNIDTNNETVKSINRVAQERGINVTYNADLFDNTNTNAIWRSNADGTREVILNPNADTNKTLESVITHELTHDLEGTNEYNELRDLILNYNENKTDYAEARKSLEELYSKVYDRNSIEFETLVDNEAVADILGNKLGNQEFVNNLTIEKPTLGRKIYNWVVDKLNKINKATGYKSEKIFWTDVKNKFENAYKQENSNNVNKDLYSIAGKKGMQNLVKSNPSNNITLEQLYNRAKQLQRNGLSNEEIRQQTNWFQDKNGDWKFEFSDKDMTLKNNIILQSGKEYKLGDILEHDTLFIAYPELINYSVEISKSLKPNGSFNSKNNIISINSELITNQKRLEATLIHEIQHAIQHIENFEGGSSSKKSKLAYYNSLGEIEASDTKSRFLNEKYKNKDIYNIAPESSKLQPQHKDLNKYLKNRNLLDKVKDSVYNYFNINNKNGKSNHEYDIEQNYTENKDKNNYTKLEEIEKKSDRKEYGIELEKFRYSINKNNSWQTYLDKNYKGTGTGQTVQEVKIAPTANNNNLETGKYTQDQENQKKQKIEEDKIAQILEKPPEKTKEKDRKWAILKANLVDKGIVFEELSHKTKNRELQGKWDYTLTANARGQNAIGQARYEMNPKTKTEKQISKSLETIRAEVGGKVSDFQQYMYHQLNIDRMTLEERFAGDTGINYERKNTIKNKPVFGDTVTAEVSRKIVEDYEKKYPQFKEWARDVYDFNNANKQELVRNGVISQELSDRLGEMYPHYVPIKRVNSKGNVIKVPLDTNRTGINAPLARAKGGNSDIQPLFQTMADRTLQTYRASARNNFGVELMNTLNTIQNVQKTDIDAILEEIGNTDSDTELLKEGKNGENPTFTVFDNGEKVTFEITKDMYDALKPVNDSSILSKTFKTPNKISNIRRGVLTEYNPLFLVTNAVKDAQDVLINSQHSLKTYSKFPEAYAQIISKGYWYKEYIRNGGEQNSYFKDGNFESDKKVNRAKKAVMIPLEKISNINNVIEMAPRLAEYIASREKGRSVETSMLDASRVTTNFKAGGDIVKFINRNGGTFLNASVQGASQQVRNIVEAHTKGLKGYAVLATKYAIAGIPALILNNLIWNDDEDYDELQDYVKDNYYIIGKYGDGKFIRIPKGRTVSVIQKIVNNVSEYVNKDKEINIDNLAKDFWESISFASDNLAPNNPIDNNVISPIIQVITNKSWYGEDIVPSRLQDKPNAEQYDETIDSFSIWLGEKLNQSPYKINYLLDQYGGGIADVVLPSLTKQAENNMVEDKFTTDSVIKSKYPGEFYTKLDELTVKNNSDNATDEDKIKYKYFSSKSKEMSDLYKEKREVQSSDLSDEEKKKQIRTIQNKINQIAKTGLEQVDNLEVSKDTAQIGTEQYYKDGKGKWNILDEEETQKNSNIPISTYADYKQKVYMQTQQKKQLGELKENQDLKDKDKIQILLDSNYPYTEKQSLYENYILDNQDKKYPIIKEAGVNIQEYLKYKLQDFSADKKDDGTVSGKSISGSSKQKRYNYIMSMKNLSNTQKLILFALEYEPSSNNEKQRIVNFVTNLDKSNEEKLEIIGQFKGVTVYKNGTFTY